MWWMTKRVPIHYDKEAEDCEFRSSDSDLSGLTRRGVQEAQDDAVLRQRRQRGLHRLDGAAHVGFDDEVDGLNAVHVPLGVAAQIEIKSIV